MKLLNLIVAIIICTCLFFVSCADDINVNESIPENQQSESVSIDEQGQSSKIPSSFLLASSEMDHTFGKMKSEYTYDEKGILKKITSYNKGNISNSETYEYDDNGYLIKKTTISYDNSGNEAFKITETYVNCADGLAQSGTIEMSGSTSTFIKTYDDKNRIVLHEQKDSSGTTVSKQEYTYLDEFDSFESVELDNRTHIVKYDKNGNELENTWLNANGDTINSSINEYDSFNNLIKSTNHENSVTEQKHTYENEILVKTEIVVDGELMSTIEYTYDEYNNLIMKKRTSVSGTVETTVNTWTPVYED